MTYIKSFKGIFCIAFLLSSTSCVSPQKQESMMPSGERCLAAESVESPIIRLVPQEVYGDEVLDLLDRRPQDGVLILQFDFFTDNHEETYPKKIAQRLTAIKKQFPKAPITVALESKKDADDPKGKGHAQRNAKTKAMLAKAGIEVRDVYGHAQDLQNPPGKEDGVSHTKLIMAGNEVIAGSNNLTKQSTDIEASNEMNISLRSDKIASTVREYVGKIIANPGQMVDIEVEDGGVRLLTDRLHFNELISQIKRAQKGDQLGLSMYQFLYRDENDQQAREVFLELIAAHKRGVQLEVFLNRAVDLETQNTSANLRVAELFLQEGIKKIYFDPEAKISHSKFLYRVSGEEKIAMISSVNIYRGDFNDNHQLTWVIKNGSLPDQLISYFKQQIAYDGVLVSRIPKESGLRYKVLEGKQKKMEWNVPTKPAKMLRFWRGFKQDSISRTEFESKVNTLLIPETIEVGGGRGLNAYLPSFFPEAKPEFLPDEVAIIDYADEEKYNAIRTTERGRKYGPLHFEEGLFTKQNSKGFTSESLVAINYSGKVELRPKGMAYVIGATDLNWQEGISLRRTLLPIHNFTPEMLQEYFLKLQESFGQLGINGAVVLVDPRYIMIMINSKDPKSAQTLDINLSLLESGKFKKFDSIVFDNQKQGSTHLASSSGINVKFESKIKPREELINTILKEVRGVKTGGIRCERFYGN